MSNVAVKRDAPSGSSGNKGQWKKPKIQGACLHGARGILFTFGDPSKTSQALRDMMNALDSVVEKAPESKVKADVSIDDAIAAELADLGTKKERFTPFKDLCKCVAFVRFNNPDDDPITVVNALFEDVIANKRPKSRFICTVLPITISTKPHNEEFEELIAKVVSEQIHPLKEGRDTPVKWCVRFNGRNNKEISRTDAQDKIANLVGISEDCGFKVSLNEPEICVVVENNPKFCGMAIVKDWVRFKNYNLMRAGGEDLDCTKKQAFVKESDEAVNVKETNGDVAAVDVNKDTE